MQWGGASALNRALQPFGFPLPRRGWATGPRGRLGLSLLEVVLGLVISGLVLLPLLQAVIALHRASVPASVSVRGRDFPTSPALAEARRAAEAHALLAAELAGAAGIRILPRYAVHDESGVFAFPTVARWAFPPGVSELLPALVGASLQTSGPEDFVVVVLRSAAGNGYAVGCLAAVRKTSENGWDGWAVDVLTRDGAQRAYVCASPSGPGPAFASCHVAEAGPGAFAGAQPSVLRFPDPSVPAWSAAGAKPLSRYHYVLDATP